MALRFIHGFELNRFKEYYRDIVGELGETEHKLVSEDPDQLIVWLEGDEIVGHAMWHTSNTAAHPSGELREDEDRRILEEALRVKGVFVELHEVWLRETSRGRGHGSAFFAYFKSMAKSRGFRQIVYYAATPQPWPYAEPGATGRPGGWNWTGSGARVEGSTSWPRN